MHKFTHFTHSNPGPLQRLKICLTRVKASEIDAPMAAKIPITKLPNSLMYAS